MVILAGAGLRHYRVDNRLDGWMPEQRAVGGYGSYVVIGGETDVLSRAVIERLRALPEVSLCLDRDAVTIWSLMGGPTPADFVAGDDGRYAGAFLFPQPGISDAQFMTAIQAALGDHRGEIAIGGPAAFAVALDATSQRRLPPLMLAITLAGLIWLWWLTGRFAVAVSAVAAVTFSQIVLIGGLSWLGRAMDMSLSVVPPLMMALGYSYAAHRAMGRSTARTTVLCWLTTLAGMGSFVVAPLPAVRNFAIWGAVGVILIWMAVNTLVPPCASAPRPRLRGVRHAVQRAAFRQALPIVVAAATLLFIGGLAIPNVPLETNPLRFFPKGSAIVEDFERLDDRLTGMMPFQVTIAGQADASTVLSQTPGVRKVIDVSAQVIDPGRTYWCLADNEALPSLIAAQPRWQAWAASAGVTLRWRGVAAQLAGSQAVLLHTALMTLPVMILIAAASVWWVTRRTEHAVTAAGLTLVPIAGLAVFGWAADMSLGQPALLIGAIATGLTIDDTLHLMAAHLRFGRPIRAHRHCWEPCMGSSLCAALCFSLFALSDFGPTRQFGLLMAGATLLAAAANQLVLPSVALLASARTARRSPARRLLPTTVAADM